MAAKLSRPAALRALAPLGVVLVGLLVLVVDGHDVSWLAGVLAGAGALLLLQPRIAARAPAARVQSPERRTADAVASLEAAGWRFLHGVRGSEAIYDHIAVGRGGVLLLESVDPSGVVTMRSGELILERTPAPGAPPVLERLRPRAVADAHAFREDVARATGRRMWVQAVVVFWSEFPAGAVADGRCAYVHGSRLTAWLARRPHQLDAADIDEVFTAVQRLAQSEGQLPLPVAV